METNRHKLDLKKEDNETYYGLVDEYNSIIGRINAINGNILQLKQPRFFLFRFKSQIKSLYEPLSVLQVLLDEWTAQYTAFVDKPSLTFSGDEEREMGFIHFMRGLEFMDARVNKLFDTTTDNFIRVQEKYNNQVNFIIAIVSAFISFVGLLIAIYSIKKN
jgi:hypothetical protein